MEVQRYSEEEAQGIMAKLQKLSCDDLHSLFKQGRVPSFEEIEGKNPGVVLAWNPKITTVYKVFWRIFGDNPFARWSGMEFIKPFDKDRKGDGFNLYRNRFWSRRFRYETFITNAVSDQELCLRINYKFPSPQSIAFDDARMIEDGVLLAQGCAKREYPWKANPLFVFYWVSVAIEQLT